MTLLLMMFELDGVNEEISRRSHSGEGDAFINIGFFDRIRREEILDDLVLSRVRDEVFALR